MKLLMKTKASMLSYMCLSCRNIMKENNSAKARRYKKSSAPNWEWKNIIINGCINCNILLESDRAAIISAMYLICFALSSSSVFSVSPRLHGIAKDDVN